MRASSLRMNRIEACSDPSLNRGRRISRADRQGRALMFQSTHPLQGRCAAVASAPPPPSDMHHYLPSIRSPVTVP